jgi:L-ascorbate metabolism protein UlaG (beta-lactamase superfamily)
MLMAASAA